MTIEEWISALRPQMVEAIAEKSYEPVKKFEDDGNVWDDCVKQAESAFDAIAPILEAGLEQTDYIDGFRDEDGNWNYYDQPRRKFRLITPKEVSE